jgi:Zn-dependent peptidase ImmA (M78 family)
VPGAVVAPPASAVGLAAAFDAAPDGAVEEEEDEEAEAEAEAAAAAAALFLPDLGLRVIKKKKFKKTSEKIKKNIYISNEN